MKKNAFAAKLMGIEVSDLSSSIEEEAQASGFVIVYGASNEMAVMAGALAGEADVPDGGTVFFDADGLLPDPDDVPESDSQAYYDRKRFAFTIEATRDKDGFKWSFSTAAPHSRFVMQMDGNPYCRGIIFSLTDIGL